MKHHTISILFFMSVVLYGQENLTRKIADPAAEREARNAKIYKIFAQDAIDKQKLLKFPEGKKNLAKLQRLESDFRVCPL